MSGLRARIDRLAVLVANRCGPGDGGSEDGWDAEMIGWASSQGREELRQKWAELGFPADDLPSLEQAAEAFEASMGRDWS